MTDKVFVVAEDKVVQSDLLFYIANRMHSTPRDDIIRTCSVFYDEKTVWTEKIKFYASISQRANARRGDDKKLKDLEDICAEMQTRDDAGTPPLPVFAATCLHNLPTSDDGAVTNAQLLSAFRELKKEMVTKEALISSLNSVKNVILNQVQKMLTEKKSGNLPLAFNSPTPSHRASPGRFLPPGPGSTPVRNNNVGDDASISQDLFSAPEQRLPETVETDQTPATSAATSATSSSATSTSASSAATSAVAPGPSPSEAPTPPLLRTPPPQQHLLPPPSQHPSPPQHLPRPQQHLLPRQQRPQLSAQQKHTSERDHGNRGRGSRGNRGNHGGRGGRPHTRDEASAASNSDRRRSRSRPSNQNIVVGKKVAEGVVSWRGADLTTNRYIGNVDIEASVDDVRTSIEGIGIKVIELEELQCRHSRHKSFRLRLKKADVPKTEQAELWPENVVIRNFFRGKDRRTSLAGTDGKTDGSAAVQRSN